jgi:hypothetical protein
MSGDEVDVEVVRQYVPPLCKVGSSSSKDADIGYLSPRMLMIVMHADVTFTIAKPACRMIIGLDGGQSTVPTKCRLTAAALELLPNV